MKSHASLSHHTVPSNLSPCRYCDQPTCPACTRQCEQCQHRFCTFCTKVDYESGVAERILCFECDEDDVRHGRRHVRGGGTAAEAEDCDMMEL